MGDTKTCSKCQVEKPVGEFYKNKGMKDGRLNDCKTCVIERQREYGEKNREVILKRNRQRYVENREAILEKQRKYHEDNREAVRAYKRRHHAENRKTILEKQQQYYKANPQLTGLNYAVSASPLTEEELLNGHTRASVNASLRFDYLLRDLIIEKTGINHHVDHIAPLSRGGLHTLGNIRVIPAKANISKSNKFDHEWHNLTDEDEEAVEATTLEWLNQREAINERHSEAPS